MKSEMQTRLEDLSAETEMELGQIDWSEGLESGVAAYPDFREAAAALTEDDFPEVKFLDDGSIIAMRLDETLPERPRPFEDALAAVDDAWTRAEIEARLTEQADGILAGLQDGATFEDAGLAATSEAALTRSDFIPGAPFSMMAEVFEMDEEGEVRVVSGEAGVVIVRLDAMLEPAQDGQTAQIREALTGQLDQQLSNALFQAFTYDTQVRANPQIDQNAVNAVLNSFQ